MRNRFGTNRSDWIYAGRIMGTVLALTVVAFLVACMYNGIWWQIVVVGVLAGTIIYHVVDFWKIRP
jgi:hypothetical protein